MARVLRFVLRNLTSSYCRSMDRDGRVRDDHIPIGLAASGDAFHVTQFDARGSRPERLELEHDDVAGSRCDRTVDRSEDDADVAVARPVDAVLGTDARLPDELAVRAADQA